MERTNSPLDVENPTQRKQHRIQWNLLILQITNLKAKRTVLICEITQQYHCIVLIF